MSVHPTFSFDDEIQRTVYEYVERNGAVTPGELARSIRIDSGPTHSKPARSGSYTESECLSTDDLESCLDALKTQGYLTETNGKLRVSLAATTTELDLEDGTASIRPAREEDRAGIIETMREVAGEETYIIAENVATQLERESALVRANEEHSRAIFVATFESESETDAGADTDADDESVTGDAEPTHDRDATSRGSPSNRTVAGWLHVDAPELPSLRHTAEVTVGVDPEFRRRGIGSSLLEYGLEWADDAGYQKLYQNLPTTNEAAIEFLEANGWQREGVHEGQYCIDEEFVDEVMLATWP
ncbi:GNAT family N-acetyltransferase [Natronorubrum halalkaliphilum]|nr:GNAT family N-acetyltransferase [Natronorubrum halalkaliphilum]